MCIRDRPESANDNYAHTYRFLVSNLLLIRISKVTFRTLYQSKYARAGSRINATSQQFTDVHALTFGDVIHPFDRTGNKGGHTLEATLYIYRGSRIHNAVHLHKRMQKRATLLLFGH